MSSIFISLLITTGLSQMKDNILILFPILEKKKGKCFGINDETTYRFLIDILYQIKTVPFYSQYS